MEMSRDRNGAPRQRIFFTALLAVAVSASSLLGNVAGGIGENGQRARPFYNVVHNPNTRAEAIESLAHGANALGPDLMRFSDGAVTLDGTAINPRAGATGLFMYHDDVLVTTRMPDTLESYLDTLHGQVKQGKNLALIVLDIKSPAAAHLASDGGRTLREAVATHLNYDGVSVNIIYNVGTTADSNYFMSNVCLGPREGIMIDGENDAAAVLNTLQAHIRNANANAGANCGGVPVPVNIAFGNGSFGEAFGLAPNVLPSIMLASWIRAGQPGIGNVAVPYAYSIEGSSRINAYITAGADGLIADANVQPQLWPLTLQQVDLLNAIVAIRPDVYPATAAENPFRPPNRAYGLRVDTADVSGAGTDVPLTFKLTGSCGSAQVTIDASYQKLFEQAGRNYVTLQSRNLGVLQKLEISSNGSCSFITAETWTAGRVQISSARWGIPYSDDRIVDFGEADVCKDEPAVVNLGSWGRECDTTPPTSTPIQVPTANASGWNKTDVAVHWNWTDNVGGSGVNPSACTTSSTSSGEGTVTLDATCTDIDENTGSKSYTVKVDKQAPTITIAQPAAVEYVHSATLTLDYAVTDARSGVASVSPALNGSATVGGAGLPDGRAIDLLSLPLGQHTFAVDAMDNAGNASQQSVVTFTLVVTAASVVDAVNQLVASGGVAPKAAASLLTKLADAKVQRDAGKCGGAANIYAAFIKEVTAQSGKGITPTAAAILIADAQYLIAHCP
jgi:hypothetical protein